MNAAKRNARRRGWPANLYEPRDNYFVWRHPKTRETHVLGRIPLAYAKNEAMRANQVIAEQALPDLVAMISGTAGHTVASLVAEMPVAEKRSTRNTFRALDKILTEGALDGEKRINGLGKVLCADLTVKHCAELLDVMVKAGKGHQAAAVRVRLSAVCALGMTKGWMSSNPAEVTAKPKTPVGRARLSLEQFLAIREASAPWPWLARAMDLALITGQDRSTIAAARRDHIVDGHLICHRSKTAAKAPPLAIPAAIRLDVVGMSLDDLLRAHTGVLSRFLVHHTEQQGRARPGAAIGVNLITRAFTEARKLAGIPDESAPTFHESRSLSKRLYDSQGGVDTKALLGHMTDAMAKLYANSRDGAPIRVQVNTP
jgi:enterobacteria phage integrase